MSLFSHHFKIQPLPPVFFFYLAVILAVYLGLTQAMKLFHSRRYGWQ